LVAEKQHLRLLPKDVRVREVIGVAPDFALDPLDLREHAPQVSDLHRPANENLASRHLEAARWRGAGGLDAREPLFELLALARVDRRAGESDARTREGLRVSEELRVREPRREALMRLIVIAETPARLAELHGRFRAARDVSRVPVDAMREIETRERPARPLERQVDLSELEESRCPLLGETERLRKPRRALELPNRASQFTSVVIVTT